MSGAKMGGAVPENEVEHIRDKVAQQVAEQKEAYRIKEIMCEYPMPAQVGFFVPLMDKSLIIVTAYEKVGNTLIRDIYEKSFKFGEFAIKDADEIFTICYEHGMKERHKDV